MGMYGCLQEVTPALEARLRADPELVAELTGDEFDLGDDSEPLEGAGAHLDMGKDFHPIHVALTGSDGDEGTGPEWDVVGGGDPIGDDLGYGPATLLNQRRTAAVAAWLASGAARNLRPDADAETNEVIDTWLSDLAEFYAGVAQRGGCVVKWVT